MKLVINVIEGFSASSKPESETISDVVSKFVDEFDENVLAYKASHSSDITNIKECGEFLNRHSFKSRALILIGKSLGAVETHRLIDRYWSTISEFGMLKVILIDAHSTFPTMYGRFRSLKVKEKWKGPGTMFFNLYQWNKFPRGARLKGAYMQTKLSDVDHDSIIFHPTTLNYIRRAFVESIGSTSE